MISKKIVAITISLFVITTSINARDAIITKDKLPLSAQEFISSNFSQKTIDYVTVDKEFLSKDYKVKFTDRSEIEFDSKGKWTEVDGNKSPIPTSFIHKDILTHIKEKFPQHDIVKIGIKRHGRYEVELSNGLELEFNSNGIFRKIDD